jgi:hypothetical protein
MPIETAHFLAGGIMPYVLERLLAQRVTASIRCAT